jgi:hypothetical protein
MSRSSCFVSPESVADELPPPSKASPDTGFFSPESVPEEQLAQSPSRLSAMICSFFMVLIVLNV